MRLSRRDFAKAMGLAGAGLVATSASGGEPRKLKPESAVRVKAYRDKALGCFMGAAIADAMGGPVECQHYRRIAKEYPDFESNEAKTRLGGFMPQEEQPETFSRRRGIPANHTAFRLCQTPLRELLERFRQEYGCQSISRAVPHPRMRKADTTAAKKIDGIRLL